MPDEAVSEVSMPLHITVLPVMATSLAWFWITVTEALPEHPLLVLAVTE